MFGSDKAPSPPVAVLGPNPPDPSQPSRVPPSHEGSSTTTVIWHAGQLRRTYASNWVPLWCGCCEPGSDMAQAAVRGLATSGLVREAGVWGKGGGTYLALMTPYPILRRGGACLATEELACPAAECNLCSCPRHRYVVVRDR